MSNGIIEVIINGWAGRIYENVAQEFLIRSHVM
jgi:hypothetical protein